MEVDVATTWDSAGRVADAAAGLEPAPFDRAIRLEPKLMPERVTRRHVLILAHHIAVDAHLLCLNQPRFRGADSYARWFNELRYRFLKRRWTASRNGNE